MKVLPLHIRDTDSDVPCPSLPFIEVINKQKQSKRKTKVPNKKQVSHSAVDVDENQSIGPNSDSTETSTEESNKLEENNSEEDIFDSVEHLWDENRQLKSSLKILDGSLVTIT